METNRSVFLNKSTATLDGLLDWMNALPELDLNQLDPQKTALIIIDMVNGFTSEGALSSPRVGRLTGKIAKIAARCKDATIPILAFCDCHTNATPEFEVYPPHCLKGTKEAELVDELKSVGVSLVIPKNSTNGFLERSFQLWLKENSQIENFIILGDCTDICILMFTTTLKADFNRRDKKARVIVPINAVDTFDYGLHNGDLSHLMALYFMAGGGVELIRKLQL